MELAYLNRYILKNRCQSSSAVNDGGFEYPTLFFKNFSPVVVMSLLFAFNFLPPDISFQAPWTEYTDAITPAPESRVQNNDGWTGCKIYMFFDLVIVKLPADPYMAFTVSRSKFQESLLASSVFFPDFSA